MSDSKIKIPKILVYAVERAGYSVPEDYAEKGMSIEYGDFECAPNFSNYDGVIMFEGIWSVWKEPERGDPYGDGEWSPVDERLMHARYKELEMLIKKGGFVCFLIGNCNRHELSAKYIDKHLIHRQSVDPKADIKSRVSELSSFAEVYAVTSSVFTRFPNQTIALLVNKHEEMVHGIVVENQIFFLPCLTKKKSAEELSAAMQVLTTGITTLSSKLGNELPTWVAEFEFGVEKPIKVRQEQVKKELLSIQGELTKFDKYKSLLSLGSDPLRLAVGSIMSEVFGFKVDLKDELVEDLSFVGNKGKTIAIIEVKGVNSNVDRAMINQTDTHREVKGLPGDIPAILIVNTSMKFAKNVKSKDIVVEDDQIKHASRNSVLVLRTLDLLRAADIVLSSPDRREEFKNLLLTKHGWLEVKDGSVIVHE